MGYFLTLPDMESIFEAARKKLALERKEILSLAPLSDFSPDTYGFSYMRAEHLGLDIVTNYLEDLLWLPMRLDPKAEIMMCEKKDIKKWMSSPKKEQPNSDIFGNDFIHALTRLALKYGWESAEFRVASLRIGRLSRDLSWLIGLIYYGVWMAENGLAGVLVSDPNDLERTALEISTLMYSPEVSLFLSQRNELLNMGLIEKRKRPAPNLYIVKNNESPEGRPLA